MTAAAQSTTQPEPSNEASHHGSKPPSTTDSPATNSKKPRKSRAKKSHSTPRSKNPKWTVQDDKQLKAAVLLQGGKNWKEIARMMDNRYTETQCLNRYKKVLNPNVIKGPWKEEEDQLLTQLVKIHGAKKWSVIASKMTGRISKQCRERWVNSLDPNINRGPWTKEEDEIIEKAHAEFGNKWSRIVSALKRHGYVRTDNGVKNHWNSTMRRERERRKLIEKGIVPAKRRKYNQRNKSLTTDLGKTPKKRKYARIVIHEATESDELFAQQQRMQQETLNGLLKPHEPVTNSDYVSTIWNPSLENSLQRRSHVVDGSISSPFAPSILKPLTGRKRARSISNSTTAVNNKRRRLSPPLDTSPSSQDSSSPTEDAEVSRRLDFSTRNGEVMSKKLQSTNGAEFQSPQQETHESTAGVNTSRVMTVSNYLSQVLPPPGLKKMSPSNPHPIFASAARMVAQWKS